LANTPIVVFITVIFSSIVAIGKRVNGKSGKAETTIFVVVYYANFVYFFLFLFKGSSKYGFPPCCPVQVLSFARCCASCIFIGTNKDDDDEVVGRWDHPRRPIHGGYAL